MDCLSKNEFDDYEDEVADKTWTLPSTNRHVEQVSSSDEEEISLDQNIPVSQPSTSTRPIQTQKTISAQKKNSRPAMQWCKTNERRKLEPGSIEWLGHADLGEPLDTLAQYFIKYFTPALLQRFAEETNKYYFRTTGHNLRTTSQEIQTFFGMSIIMANLKFPRQRMYWHHITRVDKIATTMPINRFQKIRNNIHINSDPDADRDDCNKFWKIQPLVECICRGCLKLPREEYCSVDEQMIPFEGRAPAKQFVANKPNPIGLKNFVLCGKYGRALDFELYQGAGSGIPEKDKKLALGLGGSIVLRLSETVPKRLNHKLVFDNYFWKSLIRELSTWGCKEKQTNGLLLERSERFEKRRSRSMDSTGCQKSSRS